MSSALVPTNPSEVMVIRNITPNVVTMSVPFSRFGKIMVGGRGTLLRLKSGTLAVVSPVALTPEVKAKLAELGGTVGYIIAPDIEHHIFISQWAKEFPKAKIIGPEGLPEKRASMSNSDSNIEDNQFAFVYTAENSHSSQIDEEFAANFDIEYLSMHVNKEIVLYFKPDRVLVEADLMFNLPPIEQYSKVPDAAKKRGLLDRAWGSFTSTEGDAKGQKRFLWYAMSAKDREGWNKSVRRIDTWDFTTLIPCHGETIEGAGKEVFRKVFGWHLDGKK